MSPKLINILGEEPIVITAQTVTFFVPTIISKTIMEGYLKTFNALIEALGFKDIDCIIEVSEFSKKVTQGRENLSISDKKIIADSRAKIEYKPVVTAQHETLINEVALAVSEVDETVDSGRDLTIEGEVFSFDTMKGISKKNNKEWEKVSFFLTDNKGSIECSAFVNNYNRAITKIKDGDYIKVKGKLAFNKFVKGFQLTPDLFVPAVRKIADDEQDNAERKRIELHIHSKFSKMNAVGDISEYAKIAANFGHEAIAITDHDVVQGFINLEKEAKKNNLKPLYGVELSIVTKPLILSKEHKQDFDEGEYVVFDLETTGLSANYSSIIEIGAVKLKAGQVIDRYQQFIKIDQPVSAFTTSLTGITDNDLSHGIKINDALAQFKEFIGDLVLVAHNAEFDMNFLARNYEKFLKVPLLNPALDTLELGRMLFPEKTKYGLKNLVNHYKITFSSSSHHRADYDAERTADLLLKMFADLKLKGLVNINDLNNAQEKNKKRGKHAILYAKNQDGLKSLFEVVSIANTEGFVNNARIESALLEKHRSNLLVGGSACEDGEIFDAFLNKSETEINAVFDKYDYIEIMPYEQYDHLVKMDTLSADDVYEIIKQTIMIAKSKNKLVVAVGNVHFEKAEDAYLKEILMSYTLKPEKVKELDDGTKVFPDKDRFRLMIKNNKVKVNDQYYKNTEQMKKAFSFLNDDALIEEVVVTNSRSIASQISEQIMIVKEDLFTPTINGVDQKLTTMV